MLEVRHLETTYGPSQVLYGIELQIGAGQVVTLMGRNGMGKTTTIKSICGMVPPKAGSIILEGQDIAGLPSHTIARAGIGLVPEGRQIFPNLTVKENLIATAHNLAGSPNPWTIDRVLDFFPSVAARINGMGNELSGGEQQMLALARALCIEPTLLLLDEPTEGLQPSMITLIRNSILELKKQGVSILLVEQRVDAILSIADEILVIENGSIIFSADAKEVQNDNKKLYSLIGI